MKAKTHKKEKIDSLADTKAILEFLDDVAFEIEDLKKVLRELEGLEKEREVASKGLILTNLEAQGAVLHKVIQKYEFFQNDVSINGLRVKELAQEFLRKAEKIGLKDLVKEKKKDPTWKLLW